MPQEGDWMVRFMANFEADPAKSGLGRLVKGEQKLWAAKLDYIKENDLSADLIRRSVGMSDDNFEINDNHTFVAYRYYTSKEGAAFIPTHEAMQNFAGKYGVKKVTEAQVKQVLTPDFAPKYEKAMGSSFAKGKDIWAGSKEQQIEELAEHAFPDDPETQDLFKARAAIDLSMGVFKEWDGNGLIPIAV